MKKQVSKPPKIAICRACMGTGQKMETDGHYAACPQCHGSGRVTVSAEAEYDIRPYKPRE